MPPLLDGIRFEKLLSLAHRSFALVLKKSEIQILKDSSVSEEIPPPKRGSKRPVVRAAFIRWLATDPEAAQYIDPLGLRIYAATIPDDLDLEECRIAVRMVIHRCEFQGTVYLRSARMRGIYILDSSLKEGICADRAQIDGPLFLKGIQCSGEIRLLGAEIRGALNCSGAKLTTEEKALSADGARIHGSVVLDRIKSSGEIRFLGAEIQGTLNCSGAKLKAGGDALSADGAKIHGGVFLNEGFESSGAIRFLVAEIGGSLSCSGAKLTADGDALSADGARIHGCVFLNGSFESSGMIRFTRVEIQGDLACAGARIHSMSCLNMRLAGDLIWYGIQEPDKTDWVSLGGARVKNLRDDTASWPLPGNLNLDGLEYEELTLHEEPTEDELKNKRHPKELPLKADERIQWISRQGGILSREPQPWMQLRALLEKKGDHKGAKHVSFRYQCLKASQAEWHPLRWFWRMLKAALKLFLALFDGPSWKRVAPYLRHPNRAWHRFFAWIEENPFRICLTLGCTLLFGTTFFIHYGYQGAMMETVRYQPGAVSESGEVKPVSRLYPPFQPFVYTLENTVPLIKLGMDEHWMPNSGAEFRRSRWPKIPWFYFLSTYGFLTFLRWALIVGGWTQATILAAALAERFKHD